MKEKNPFRVMLGKFLRHERKRLRLKTTDISASLQASNSFYRLIECGLGSLSSGRAPYLMSALKNPRIKFDKLVIYLGAAEHFDFLADTKMTTRDRIRGVSILSEDLGEFLNNISKYMDIVIDENSNLVWNNEVHMEMMHFLCNDSYSDISENEKLNDKMFKAITDLPQSTQDLLLKFLEDLGQERK